MSAEPYYSDEFVTLYHGDCLEVLSAIPVAAVTITSPPYWNARTYDSGIGWPTYAGYCDWLGQVLTRLHSHTGWLVWNAGYIWSDGHLHDCPGDAARLAVAAGFEWRIQVPWVKDDYAPQPSIDLAPAHEMFEVLRTQNAGDGYWDELRVLRRHAERLGRVAAERPSGGAQRGGGIGFGHERMDGKKQAPNVLVAPRLNGADRLGHPAAFPPEVVEPWVTACSRPGDIVLDPFAGSGTSLTVAKRAGRRAIGIDRSERYCEIAAKRLSQGVLDFGAVS